MVDRMHARRGLARSNINAHDEIDFHVGVGIGLIVRRKAQHIGGVTELRKLLMRRGHRVITNQLHIDARNNARKVRNRCAQRRCELFARSHRLPR